MKKHIRYLALLTIPFFAISCGSAPKAEAEKPSEPQEIQEPEPEETAIISDDDEVVDVVDEPATISQTDDEEYLRSTNNLSAEESVTKDEFEEDKAEILRIISELQKVMEKEDYNAWIKYIAPDSIRYYSNPANIRKAQKKLPDKTIQLHGIEDYFKYVFIPARKRSQVTEIRYVSKTNIKAVEVKSNGKITVYYQFVKLDDRWLVHIPSL